jgi:hypothetical protein
MLFKGPTNVHKLCSFFLKYCVWQGIFLLLMWPKCLSFKNIHCMLKLVSIFPWHRRFSWTENLQTGFKFSHEKNISILNTGFLTKHGGHHSTLATIFDVFSSSMFYHVLSNKPFPWLRAYVQKWSNLVKCIISCYHTQTATINWTKFRHVNNVNDKMKRRFALHSMNIYKLEKRILM